MNNDKTKEVVREKSNEKLNKVIDELVRTKGYVAPVDVMLKMGLISQKDYADWRRGKILFLEKAASVDLSRLSRIMRELKGTARKKFLKPSKTIYKRWGNGAKGNLRFSKTGAKHIEEAYSTHYVGKKSQNQDQPQVKEFKETKFEKRMREKRMKEEKTLS